MPNLIHSYLLIGSLIHKRLLVARAGRNCTADVHMPGSVCLTHFSQGPSLYLSTTCFRLDDLPNKRMYAIVDTAAKSVNLTPKREMIGQKKGHFYTGDKRSFRSGQKMRY